MNEIKSAVREKRTTEAPILEIANGLRDCMESNEGLIMKLRELIFGEERVNALKEERGSFGLAAKIDESFRFAVDVNKELCDIIARLGG